MAGYSDDDIALASRSKLAALNTGLVNAMAEVKLCEKQVAELQKKVGVLEARLAAGSPSPTATMLLGSQLDTAKQELAGISVRLNTALAQIAKYKAEIGQLPGQTQDAMTTNTIANMQESIAGLTSSFGGNDPASVIDEMKSKIGARPSAAKLDLVEHDLVAEADRKLQQTEIEQMLSTYKQQLGSDPAPLQPARDPGPISEETDEKTLGPSDKPLTPVD